MGGHLCECLRGGVPHFRDELWGLVGETDGVVLAAGDENFSIGENKAVGGMRRGSPWD